MELTNNEAILRLFVALLLGSIVGFEREYSQQSAGLRTHILVCLGSAIFTLVSISNMNHGINFSDLPEGVDYRIVRDPARIAAQVVAGIGFIGGGAVLRHGASVRGLTTAASLWTIASIGMMAATGYYRLAIIATLFTFLVLFTIGALERSMFKKYLKKYSRLRVQLMAKEQKLPEVENWLERTFGKKIVELRTSRGEDNDQISMTYVIDLRGMQVEVHDLARRLNAQEGVTSANIKVYHEESED